MLEAQKRLYNEIGNLPEDICNKALSYIRFLKYKEDEDDDDLYLTEEEDAKLQKIFESGDFVDASVIRAMIEAMPDD